MGFSRWEVGEAKNGREKGITKQEGEGSWGSSEHASQGGSEASESRDAMRVLRHSPAEMSRSQSENL